MEISPIAGIRIMPVTKARPVDSDLTVPFEIESAARVDDDTYAPGQKRASGAEDSDEETEEIESLPEGEPTEAREELPSRSKINFFA